MASSITNGYDLALKSLLYDRFASIIGIDSLSSSRETNMNQGLIQCPFELARRMTSEKRGSTFLEFMSFYKVGISPSWSRQRSVVAQRGLWVARDIDKSYLTNVKAQPIDISYDVWFWSKSLDKVNQCMEEYIFWQQENPKVVLLYNDLYPIRPDLHFGDIVNESTYPDQFDKGADFILRMPIKMDGWVFKSTTAEVIRKIVLTVYDKNDVEDYSEIIGTDPDTELESALRFLRKSIYNIFAVDLLANSLTIAGTYGSDFSVGDKLIIRDSTGNDGMYTLLSVSEGEDSTIVIVEETLPDSTADGVIQKRD